MDKRLEGNVESETGRGNDDLFADDDAFGGDEVSVKLKYRTDTLPGKSAICMAVRIDTGTLLKKWKKDREGRLSWHLTDFLQRVAMYDREQGTNHDILLSIYGLDHLGVSDPTYAEFKRFWAGRPLSDFYLILSAPEKDPLIGEAFSFYLREEGFPVADVQAIGGMPRNAFPVYRLKKGEICLYVEQVEIDSARGPQPCAVFFGFRKNWPSYSCCPMDPDPCLSQDLAAGLKHFRPSLVLSESSDGVLKVELKQYKWKAVGQPDKRQKAA